MAVIVLVTEPALTALTIAGPGRSWSFPLRFPMLDARVDRIVATEVIVKARPGYVDRPAFGDSIFDKTSKWIVEVHTEAGATGIGETHRGCGGGTVRWAAEQLLGRSLRSLPWHSPLPVDLRGDDTFGHPDPPVPNRMHEFAFPRGAAETAMRVALADLWGQALGVPVHALLGECCRRRVAVSWWFGRSDAAHAAEQMRIGLDQGFTAVKFKAAAEDDVAGIVQAVKTVAGAEALVIIDPNNRFYRLTEALDIARRLESHDQIVFEDPFPFLPDEWQLFRQRSRIPLALHAQSAQALVHGAARPFDYVNLGGPDCLFTAELAWRHRLQCWFGSGLELGILDAWILHHAAVARACSLPNDVGHLIREDDLIAQTLAVRDGALTVPDEPGLGVTLDPVALARYTVGRFEVA